MKLIVPVVVMLSLVSPAVCADMLSQSVGLFVYPSQEQSKEQQGKDDYECYNWAQQQTGVDPMHPPEAEVVKPKSGADGARLRGALRGAARGAVIGEIADDDAGKGAEIGAAVGVMRGGAQSRHAKQASAAQATAANEAAVAEQLGGFKKAMSACLTARGYSVQ